MVLPPSQSSAAKRNIPAEFDKVMFNLPIPRFDASGPLPNDIAGAARR
jgi:hypothetical protein